MIEAQAHRRFDVGLGYQLEDSPGDRTRTISGPFIELGLMPLQADLGRDLRGRVGTFALAEVFLLERAGYGFTVGLNAEVTDFVSGPLRGSNVVGAAVGEWSIGPYVAIGYRNTRLDRYWTASIGLSGHIPLVFGLYCCIIESTDLDSEETEPDYRTSREHPRKGRGTRTRRSERKPARAKPRPAADAPQRKPARPKPRSASDDPQRKPAQPTLERRSR